MPISNYPNGFANGVTIRGIPITQMHPGEVFWVGNSAVLLTGEKNASDGNKGTFLQPFSTIDYAVGKCGAGRGDIIMIRPGYTQTIIAADGIVADVAGVAFVGLGSGNSKPTITFTTATTADIDVDAANVSFSNIRFVSGIANLAAPLDINAAHCSFSKCEFMASVATTGMNIAILPDANATGLSVTDCTFNMESSVLGVAVTDVPTEAVRLVGTDNAVINDNFFVGNFSTAAVNGITTASEGIQINRNYIHNVTTTAVAGGIDLVAGCTGHVSANLVGSYETTTIDTVIDNAACSTCFNHVINVITEVSDLGGAIST